LEKSIEAKHEAAQKNEEDDHDEEPAEKKEETLCLSGCSW
jgi:hypothetical protein